MVENKSTLSTQLL